MEHNTQKQKGFTLVELSIVLVIIGLIVGGVLVGQDLIQAAKIRAQVAQFERTDAGIATFYAKYNAYPGDIEQMKASAFGLTGGAGNVGDGNGVVDGAVATAGVQNTFADEVVDFWNHLSEAALIPGGAADALPESSLGKGSIGVGTADARGGMTGNARAGKLYYVAGLVSDGITYSITHTPNEVFQIDAKMDDGTPDRGKVQALDDTAATLTTTAAPFPSAVTSNAANCTESSQYNAALESGLCSYIVLTGL